MVTRVDGFGCNGCINCTEVHNVFYCKVSDLDFDFTKDRVFVGYRIIEDVCTKPTWCKYY